MGLLLLVVSQVVMEMLLLDSALNYLGNLLVFSQTVSLSQVM